MGGGFFYSSSWLCIMYIHYTLYVIQPPKSDFRFIYFSKIQTRANLEFIREAKANAIPELFGVSLPIPVIVFR